MRRHPKGIWITFLSAKNYCINQITNSNGIKLALVLKFRHETDHQQTGEKKEINGLRGSRGRTLPCNPRLVSWIWFFFRVSLACSYIVEGVCNVAIHGDVVHLS